MAKAQEGPGSRLPRVPHAEKPRDGEKVFKRTGADLQNGWLARHGDLFLTEDRLVFVPTLLDTALMANVIEGANIGMTDAGYRTRLAIEAVARGRRIGQVCRQNFDGNRSIQACIASPIHFTHAAGPDRRSDFIRTEPCSNG